MTDLTATTDELRDAFRDSGLWRAGWTFARAQACPLVWQSLNCMVRARRRKAAAHGQAQPAQIALI